MVRGGIAGTIACLAVMAMVTPASAHAVVGGEEATSLVGAVSLENKSLDAPPQHVCTGVLISPQWVLTANHCLRAYVMGSARVGGLDRAEAATVVVEAQYEAPRGDLGLVKLASSAPGPYASYATRKPKSGERVTTLGFGAKSSDGTPSTALRASTGRVLAVGTDPEFGGEMISWAFERGRTGVGDSGGPMMVDGVVLGVHSGIFGSDGGAAGFAESLQWIRQVSAIGPMSGSGGGGGFNALPLPSPTVEVPVPVSAEASGRARGARVTVVAGDGCQRDRSCIA